LLRFAIRALAAAACAYQLAAIVASVRQQRRMRRAAPAPLGSVSVLKPVRGAEYGFERAVRSNAAQDHPQFEVLFGVRAGDDAARAAIDRVAREFPEGRIREIAVSGSRPNQKVAALIELARAAKGEYLVVSDADIAVPGDYLRRIIAPLADSNIGLVTCVYRARARAWPARVEALGVATDFAPGAMVAPLVGVDEFGLGATLAFRARDLERIGGFEAIADYLADDYQLGRRLHELGLRCVLSEVVVETALASESWSAMWRHQLRWARTIRFSRPGGYAGLPLSNATLWAVAAAAMRDWPVAAALMTVRLAMAAAAGWGVLRSGDAIRLLWLAPARDLFGAAVWFAGLFGRTVEWGGVRLELGREGRIARISREA
jgi:ceramide glucosyltransferase